MLPNCGLDSDPLSKALMGGWRFLSQRLQRFTGGVCTEDRSVGS